MQALSRVCPSSGDTLNRRETDRFRSDAALTEDDMDDKFRALLVTKDGDRQSVAVTELTDADLMEGDVTVAVEHSTVNYKDGLAITGKAPIIRKFPLIPGIDLAGKVLSSEDPRFQTGDRVVLNGYGLGEVHHGGYAERARVKGDWLIRLPENISTANAMAIGTAGYTSMLCVLALESAGVTPDKGDVLVTGAAGGVGSVAIALLDKLDYRVVASSRRAEQERDYLQGLGADEIIDARELSGVGSPLGKERWAGAVDSLGSRTLANVLMQGTGILMMMLFLHLFFGPWRRFGHAVERKAFPKAAKELDQIRRIVAINLVLGLLTVSVGASGRFW
jgi:acrylyl-CoA reductase (NADPH)